MYPQTNIQTDGQTDKKPILMYLVSIESIVHRISVSHIILLSVNCHFEHITVIIK